MRYTLAATITLLLCLTGFTAMGAQPEKQDKPGEITILYTANTRGVLSPCKT